MCVSFSILIVMICHIGFIVILLHFFRSILCFLVFLLLPVDFGSGTRNLFESWEDSTEWTVESAVEITNPDKIVGSSRERGLREGVVVRREKRGESRRGGE